MLTQNLHPDQVVDADRSGQAEAIAFLSDPSSFEGHVDSVTRINTHAAIVFLAGDHAYKIKRAVRYPYLDFSTLENRRLFCKREVRRNMTTASDIYVAAVPLVRTSSGQIALNKPGQPIEWVVVMRRFDQSLLLDNMANRNTLSRVHVSLLADVIAEYHAWAPISNDFDSEACFDEIVSTVIASLSSAADLIGLDTVKDFASQLLRHQNATRSTLRDRAQDGMVRLCHGDLHLKNIVLWRNQPTLFDAIEFSDEIATQDVFFDLAFVLMDLWLRDLKQHANLLFNRYLWHPETSDKLSGLSALPMFMALRAAIRAMVCLDRLPFVEQNRDDTERELKHYFQLACQLLVDGKPRLIAIGGRSGTGKSTLAESVAHEIGRAPGALHLRSDVERKKMLGVTMDQKLDENAYKASISDAVYRILFDKARDALGAGQSVIVDATFLSTEHRKTIETVALEAGVQFAGLWLEAQEDELLARVAKRHCDASDADTSIVQKQMQVDAGSVSWHHVDANRPRERLRETVSRLIFESDRQTK